MYICWLTPTLVRNVIFLLLTIMYLSGNAQSQITSESEEIFDLKKVWEVNLKLEPEEWEKLQPNWEDLDLNIGTAFRKIIMDSFMRKPFRSSLSSRPGLAGYMGFNHQYGTADVIFGDKIIKNVGLRYKGNGSAMMAVMDSNLGFGSVRKFSFKIDFNKYNQNQDFGGLIKINLNNNSENPSSSIRESLSYAIFRRAGVPCSRAGFAKVYLSINSQVEKIYLGLYNLVEQVDKRFLADRFGSRKGMLLKPSTFGAFKYLGENWESYKAHYNPKTDVTPEQGRRLIEFTKLIQQSNDQTFKQKIESFLDTDAFLRFMAVNVLLSNLDSYLGSNQNHYVYLDPVTKKFQLIPWDLDISFGAFGLVGTPESRRDLSIHRPHHGQNRLIERVLGIAKYKKEYQNHLRKYLDAIFTQEKLYLEIDSMIDLLYPVVALEGKEMLRRFEQSLNGTSTWDRSNPIKQFIKGRCRSVKDQLEGTSKGEIIYTR